MDNNLIKHRSLVLSLSNQVKEICDPFLQRFNLNYFWYFRIYKDCTKVSLSGHSDIREWFTTNNLFLPQKDNSNFLFGQKCYEKYFWSQGQLNLRSKLNRENHCLQMAGLREFFNVDHCFTIIEKYDEFCDFYDFGAPRNNPGIVNFYVNHLDVLEQFICYFKDRSRELRVQVECSSRKLLHPVEGDKITPIIIKNIDYNNIALPKRYYINTDSYLTNRELECFLYLLKGQSVKEIANSLYRSPKTVENHVDAIKRKLGCTKRSILFNKGIELGLITITDYGKTKRGL